MLPLPGCPWPSEGKDSCNRFVSDRTEEMRQTAWRGDRPNGKNRNDPWLRFSSVIKGHFCSLLISNIICLSSWILCLPFAFHDRILKNLYKIYFGIWISLNALLGWFLNNGVSFCIFWFWIRLLWQKASGDWLWFLMTTHWLSSLGPYHQMPRSVLWSLCVQIVSVCSKSLF